jgi:hypothetical protein
VIAEPTSVLAKRVNARGSCTTVKVDDENDPWFPPTRLPHELIKLARRACAGCPVIVECRELTLRTEAQVRPATIEGIFGGLAPHERRALIRVRRRLGGAA